MSNKSTNNKEEDEHQEREIFPGVYMTDYRNSSSNISMEEKRERLNRITDALRDEELAKLTPEELIERLNELEMQTAMMKIDERDNNLPTEKPNTTNSCSLITEAALREINDKNLVVSDGLGHSPVEMLHQMEYDLTQIEQMIRQLRSVYNLKCTL